MNAANRNSLWAGVFVDELVRAGLRAVCIAPGSRSTPLTLAFAEHLGIKVYSLLDERSAAFFALGMALAGGEPAAVVCTSGTAAANFYPAVVEANYAQVPLLILTTDRPHELRHSGANQTIDQVKLYGDHVRWFVDVAPPEANPAPSTIRALRTLACRALAAAAGLPPGPVHLNFPFRKPLEPIPVPADLSDLLEPGSQAAAGFEGRREGQPFTRITRGPCLPSAEQLNDLVQTIQDAPRGLIICGPRCPGGGFAQVVTRLAQATGYPVLADALSGVRFGSHIAAAEPFIFGSYETFLQRDVVAQWPAPDLILRFGAMPISKALADYLAAASTSRQVAVSGAGTWPDEAHLINDLIWAEPEALCDLIVERLGTGSNLSGDPGWLATFREAEHQAQQAFQAFNSSNVLSLLSETRTEGQNTVQNESYSESLFEGAILADVVELMPPDALLYVASSLPIRHLDQFVKPGPAPLRVFANRGASGIDGTIASALGVAATTDRPLVLVIGDLAFYHDMNSLLALQRCRLKATIVLLNNNGGGIFHRLPIANFEPPFTELFVTPHGLNFEPVARMFGAGHTTARTQAGFRQAFEASIGAETPQVIEVFSDSILHEKIRREIITNVIRQLVPVNRQIPN